MSENSSETGGMSRLQKYALWRVISGVVIAFPFLYVLETERRHGLLFFFLIFAFMSIVSATSLLIKRMQNRWHPGAGNRLDEFESRIEVKSYYVAGRWTVLLYVMCGGLCLSLTSPQEGIIGMFPFMCFLFGAFLFYELAHLVGVFYYTRRREDLEEREWLVR